MSLLKFDREMLGVVGGLVFTDLARLARRWSVFWFYGDS